MWGKQRCFFKNNLTGLFVIQKDVTSQDENDLTGLENILYYYESNKNNWGYYDYNLNNVSTWLNMMNTFMDNGDESWLDFRIPDYPDYSLVDKYINEFFPDYI